MLIVQNEFQPGRIQNGLLDLMRDGITAVRICSAYISMSGSEILFDYMHRSTARGNLREVTKTIVASLDFGLTEPEALQFWKNTETCEVLVAGASDLAQGNLVPQSAFHIKCYVFDRPDGSIGTLIGSANLTSRGLTINSEVAWLETRHDDTDQVNSAWNEMIVPAEPLTDEILIDERCLEFLVDAVDRVRKSRLVIGKVKPQFSRSGFSPHLRSSCVVLRYAVKGSKRRDACLYRHYPRAVPGHYV